MHSSLHCYQFNFGKIERMLFCTVNLSTGLAFHTKHVSAVLMTLFTVHHGLNTGTFNGNVIVSLHGTVAPVPTSLVCFTFDKCSFTYQSNFHT